MADTPITLNNYSDDSQIKAFMNTELAVRVFHDIPLNVLNAGKFSLTTEYISQITEQLAFASSFYYNENFITKAILPDSIYAEAAIFNIGYAFATPASSNFLLELRIDDIMNNAVYNADNGLYEFILDKNTKFNLPEGFIYSLDYDILIQYKSEGTATIDAKIPAWNIQYINRDQVNMCATNKNLYIPYRVTDVWLCLFVQANEYERQVHTVVNNTSYDIPGADTVIHCNDHIAGFDIKYIDASGNETYLDRDHILTVHGKVQDLKPYVNYIMDDPYTIRFMWQLAGNKYFVPETNSSYEIIVYTCHGKAANAPNYKNDTQPQIITATNRYTNNANVTKAVFVIGGCLGGTDIGSVETVRRQTIEAYNTAKVISTDHDIDEWFKTFYFKGLLYPFFFKRRDDPWGRIWSGYISLTNENDDVYQTNTLHGALTYDELYNNSDSTVSTNEIIIPPGWLWTYVDGGNRYTVRPYIDKGNTKIETAKSHLSIDDKFVFANPFGIRIQKDPFAIGYFNPWINQYVSASHVDTDVPRTDSLYHASHIISHIQRTYMRDYYDINTTIISNVEGMIGDGSPLVQYTKNKSTKTDIPDSMWNYFKEPLDMYAKDLPMLQLSSKDGYIAFDPTKTYLTCLTRDKSDDDKTWILKGVSIMDETHADTLVTNLAITNTIYAYDSTWPDLEKYKVYHTGETEIHIYADDETMTNYLKFTRIPSKNYYELRLPDSAENGTISRITVTLATETDLTKYGEETLVRIGESYNNVTFNVYYNVEGNEKRVTYTITNPANVYIPYELPESEGGLYTFNFENVGSNGIILYADMKPSPSSGFVQYYKIPFSDIDPETALFYIKSNTLPFDKNNMRVVMTAIANGSVTGRTEMKPVSVENDGSYIFGTEIYPLTELIDLDNRIYVASTTNGGGSWEDVGSNKTYIDATNPEFKISILFKNENDSNSASPYDDGDSFTGYYIVDEYTLDDVDLVQELKEMRSVVDFGDYDPPTEAEQTLYNDMTALGVNNAKTYNIYRMTEYAYKRKYELIPDTYSDIEFTMFQEAAAANRNILQEYFVAYMDLRISSTRPAWFDSFITMLNTITNFKEYVLLTEEPSDFDPTKYYKRDGSEYEPGRPTDQWLPNVWYEKCTLDWNYLYSTLSEYGNDVINSFSGLNVDGDIIIQQVPFVSKALITDDRFADFVAAFTQVHKAIEPVIFERLDGNNYLDCKLIATYGKPHSYSSDLDINDPNRFWPDLSVQLEFDVKLYDQGLEKTTVNDLKTIIRSYFNKITTVHTPTQNLSMDNNIYISNVIQLMEEHENVAWLKFKGWYTDEKSNPTGNYMDPSVQAIEQKWKKLEDMPTDELERYVPEMFVLDNSNIVINVIK